METENNNDVQFQKSQGGGKNKSTIVKIVVLALIMLAFGGAGGYIWRDREAVNTDKLRTDEIGALEKSNTNLRAELETAKQTAASGGDAAKAPSGATLENIEAAISSGNTAALEGYMASSVNVILAASEAYGAQSPAQAINDLEYLNDATNPWDFNLPVATLAQYQSGGYSQYFPTSAHVGKSANGYVISFQFGSSEKISGIFMTSSAELL